MLVFDVLIRHIGPKAVKISLQRSASDNKGLKAMRAPGVRGRANATRKWLESYNVFQGFDTAQRTALSRTILRWADSQGRYSRMGALDTLAQTHAALAQACSRAVGGERDFTSLASKALWLRYPRQVPICDRFVERALWTLSKLEPDLPPVPEGATR